MAVPTGAVAGAATKISIKIPPASVFSPLAEVFELAPPNVSIAKIDTTVLVSTQMTSIPSIPDNGEVKFTILYIPNGAGFGLLNPLTVTPAVVKWQIQLSDGTPSTGTGTIIPFDGYVSGWEPKGFKIGDKAVADVTITVTKLDSIIAAT